MRSVTIHMTDPGAGIINRPFMVDAGKTVRTFLTERWGALRSGIQVAVNGAPASLDTVLDSSATLSIAPQKVAGS